MESPDFGIVRTSLNNYHDYDCVWITKEALKWNSVHIKINLAFYKR